MSTERDLPDSFKSTVVSIVPFEIHERKPGIYPGDFLLPASIDEKPEVLIVGESHHFVNLMDERSIRVNIPSYELARSIVEDYITSQLAVTSEAKPGIFFVPGVVTKESVPIRHKVLFEEAKKAQKNWFMRLVLLADDDWQRYHQHKAISDTQRFAARALGLEREWLIVTKDETLKTCPACFQTIHPESVVCAFCKAVINAEKYKEFTFSK